MRKLLEWLGGSVLVYAAVAACSVETSGGTRARPLDVGATGAGGVSGSATVEDSGLADVVADALDAMVNPVPDAQAQPTGPVFTPQTIPCNTMIEWSNGSELSHATLTVPGAGVAKLGAIVHTVSGEGVLHPLGYDQQVAAGGFVAGDTLVVPCLAGQTVTFYVPG